MMRKKLLLLNPQLEVFLAVAKNKSMHGAAKDICLSQTAITKRIKLLESRLQTTLFIRTRHGVQLTTDGEALLRYCYITQDLEGETLANIKKSGTELTARIGIIGPCSTMTSRIIPLCLPILKRFPCLFVNFEVLDCESRIKFLQNGTHQFAVIEPQYVLREMQTKKLKDEEYILVCSSQWKNKTIRDIVENETIIDFYASDFTTYNYLKKFHLFEFAKKERHFVNRTGLLIKMFVEGLGYGVLTKEFAKPYLESYQLIQLNSGKIYKNSLVLAWYKRPELPRYFKEIIQAIK